MEKILDTYFRKISLDEIINRFISKDSFSKEHYYKSPKNILDSSGHFDEYTKDEKENIFLNNNRNLSLDYYSENNIFNLLVNYGKKTLREIEKEPICRYEYLLNWSETTRHIGEEIITTSFFAYSDVAKLYQRHFFSWKPITSSDNTRISKILSQGIAENHFHLKASAQNDSISWISLMNNITKRSKDFKDLEKDTNNDYKYTYNLIKKACFIRYYLYSLIKNYDVKYSEKNLLKKLLSNDFIDMFINQIQHEINAIKSLQGLSFNLDGNKVIPDYCIPNNITESNFNGNIFLCGERYFLYNVFKLIYSEKLNEEDKELFYIYLLIKSKFREKLIQLNNKVGLSNFIDYERKKEIFIQSKSIYEKFLHNMAISSSIKNQNIVSLEARTTPKEKAKDISKAIKYMDKNISLDVFSNPNFSRFDSFLNKSSDEIKKIHFYTVHFIKATEKLKKHKNKAYDEILNLNIKPRSFNLRKKLKKQTYALKKLRQSISKTSKRIFGIDSAGQEVGVRPEIFAQTFRFLKAHNIDQKNEFLKTIDIPRLGATFHAGEDFLDIVDGLRYIDEAIKFSNLEQGDRLGHALALGIDANDYYNFKNLKVFISKQDLLDNIVWLLSRIRKYSLNDYGLSDLLEKKYNRLFLEVYKSTLDSSRDLFLQSIPNHSVYFNAWKLRGDNPSLYSKGYFDKNHLCLTDWDKYAKNNLYPKKSEIREIKEVSFLYYSYHYDYEVRKKGSEIEEFEIENNYIKVVQNVQKQMQLEISKKGIAIETNPSSNYIISSFKKYSKHPIINWFNLGLEVDPIKLKDCPQISVSINTDDQGIFNTYLENEYALMALALEREKDEFGNSLYNQTMIYQWLDHIRKMGLEQSFRLLR